MELQKQVQRQLARALDNFKKIGRKNYTPANVRSRISTLKEVWSRFVEGHAAILATTPEAMQATLSYFREETFEATEDLYNATLDYMAEILEELEPPVSPNRSVDFSYSRASTSTFSLSHLPPIQIPPFDGTAVEWEPFRDRFSALIIENKELTDFTRMHFLISFLRGRALESLTNLAVTADNFKAAWQTLRDRYDNKRRLLAVHLSALLGLPHLSRESSVDLQSLRSTVNLTITSLRNLQRDSADLWNDIVVHIVSQCLDSVTRKAWNLKSADGTDPPTFEELDKFIANRVRALEDFSPSESKSTTKSAGQARVHAATTSTSSKAPCPICKAQHFFSSCPTFARGTPSQRRELVKKHRRCFNCLSAHHAAHECKSKFSCRTCSQRHHSQLHVASESSSRAPADPTPPESSTPATEEKTEATTHLTAASAKRRAPVLLATARVRVSSSSGRVIVARALVDQGSEISFVSENTVQLLRAKRVRMPISVSAVGCVSAGTLRHAADIRLSALSFPSPSFAATALILKTLTSYSPRSSIAASCLKHLGDLPWADPDPLSTDPIDVIIGADLYGEILRDGFRRGAVGQPVAQLTAFGWIISGPVAAMERGETLRDSTIDEASTVNSVVALHCCGGPSLDDELRRFWEVEEVPHASFRTPADEVCENHFRTTHSRDANGRYIVRLPFKAEPPLAIGDSRCRAARSFASLQRRLSGNPANRLAYCEFMHEYEDLGHMRRTPDSPDSTGQIVYIPHHPVFREHSLTTSLRVVFNASSPTTNGSSLNDHLLAGPKLQTDLPAVIMRWRNFRYVYSADMAKMYRQIRIDSRDLDFQRVLWTDSCDSKPVEYQLLTVTYGMSCAPFLALRVIHQLILDEGDNFPLAASVLKSNIYVDDVLFGADNVSDLNQIREQLTALLRRGGFELRKWSSNSPVLLSDIDERNHGLACSKDLAADDTVKILGISWSPGDDVFQFVVSLSAPIPTTKRSILSMIAKIYDPLGWVTPVTITAKILMQHLWRQRIGWDDPIPDALLARWQAIYSNLSSLAGIRLPRWTAFAQTARHVELHGFADASNAAYSAVVYLKIITRDDRVHISILTGKSKVAPLSPLSVPRLELAAAAVLARLINYVTTSLEFQTVPCYCWSDSTVVLTWLSHHPSRWKVYVANRVAEIQTRLPTAVWRHVPTADNPADCASRGLLGDEIIQHHLWWHGPPWLAHDSDAWPQSINLTTDTSYLEEKSVALHLISPAAPYDVFDRFSSWPKLIRVIAYACRFIAACRRGQLRLSDETIRSRALTARECSAARIKILKLMQAEFFPKEIQLLTRHCELPTKNSLLALRPFLDSDGLLRIGGRISRALIPFSQCHPILLSSHHVTRLIISHAHLRALHAGVQLTLNILRRDFWVIRARGVVKSVIHQCVACTRERAAIPTQIMADLPKERVTATTRCFLNCGLDYAGPVAIRASAGRGIVSRKAYIALFICLTTRAVHLELVVDYSTKAFLNAFSRFTARRGLPETIFSDNGTTFVGADRELATAYRATLLDANFQNRTASDGIKWKFIPPSAPHFGGIWEAGIKSVKHHVRRTLKNYTLTFEEFATLLCQVEACLNSRPIAPLSDSPEDYTPLTPGHFLIGSAITTSPEPSTFDVNENRLTRWQLVRQLTERFWRLWHNDYINSLQQRGKWRHQHPSIKVGQLVLLRNANLPPCKWELARVTQCHPGTDGLVRVVTIRTASSELKRPIAKLCLLPIETEQTGHPH